MVDATVEERPYSGAVVVVAALGTFFFPIISLIAALIMRSGERDERRRAQLRTWALLSAGWVALQLILAVLLFSVVAWSTDAEIDSDRSGPCVGGPVIGEAVKADSRGRAVVPCEISGTATVTIGG